MDPKQPDVGGEQFGTLRDHLRKHPEIKYVWYDYWCMSQHSPHDNQFGQAVDDRSPAEKEEFKWMLQNVDRLYLGALVLVMVDLSYLSRFWVSLYLSLTYELCSHVPAGAFTPESHSMSLDCRRPNLRLGCQCSSALRKASHLLTPLIAVQHSCLRSTVLQNWRNMCRIFGPKRHQWRLTTSLHFGMSL